MPNYEFACEDCGNQFEVRMKISERDDSQKCPSCGSDKVKRSYGSFTVPNFHGTHFKSQVEWKKPAEKVYLGNKAKPQRWGFSKT